MSAKYLIINGQFNEIVTKNLYEGAVASFHDHGVSKDRIDAVWVPGAFEIPVTAVKAAKSGRYDAIVCLGCVIRGETPHFDYVAGQCASGIMKASIDYSIPIIFGVLTTDTVDQAMNRAGLKHGNKGRDAAAAAVSMVATLKRFES